MAAFSQLSDWLDFLADFMPPAGYLLVGAGSGTGDWVRYLMARQAGSVTLVEADERAFRHLQAIAPDQPGWHVLNQVVARQTGPCRFFHATLSPESGLLDPVSLRGIWPNLGTVGETVRDCVSLTDLMASRNLRANWLWIDCFPALDLIEGADGMLGRVDVILARTRLSGGRAVAGPPGTSAGELQQWLEPRGLRLIHEFAGWNPSLGMALFVRDTRSMSVKQGCGDETAIPVGREAVEHAGGIEHERPTRQGKTYYGLHGLDRKLEAYLNYRNGYFVELGANDGTTQSNTLYFEKNRGWSGLLIEPVLHNFLKCRARRSPENHYACSACVSSSYLLPYVQLVYSNLMTAPLGVEGDIVDPRAHAESGRIHLSKEEIPVEILAPARTLTSLLDEVGAPPLIDFLSLDVEGAEMEVLKGIDHGRYRFRFLLVESREIEPVNVYLAGHGYKRIDQLSHHDYLFSIVPRQGE